jgi:uncharacterized protein (DUF2132 family)
MEGLCSLSPQGRIPREGDDGKQPASLNSEWSLDDSELVKLARSLWELFPLAISFAIPSNCFNIAPNMHSLLLYLDCVRQTTWRKSRLDSELCHRTMLLLQRGLGVEYVSLKQTKHDVNWTKPRNTPRAQQPTT